MCPAFKNVNNYPNELSILDQAFQRKLKVNICLKMHEKLLSTWLKMILCLERKKIVSDVKVYSIELPCFSLVRFPVSNICHRTGLIFNFSSEQISDLFKSNFLHL